MRCGVSSRQTGSAGLQSVAVSWALFGGLLIVAAAVTTFDAETLGTMMLGIANAAAGLWISRSRRRRRAAPRQPS